jgi:hypothetical protein
LNLQTAREFISVKCRHGARPGAGAGAAAPDRPASLSLSLGLPGGGGRSRRSARPLAELSAAITSAVLFKRALSYPFLQSINECGRPTPKEHSMVLADKPRVRAREERENQARERERGERAKHLVCLRVCTLCIINFEPRVCASTDTCLRFCCC